MLQFENKEYERILKSSRRRGKFAKDCEKLLAAMLPATSLFHMTFRYNSGRALMMGARKKGRQPLWLQRLKGAEMLDQAVRTARHPLMRETMRECMEDLWDVKGLQELLEDIRAGVVTVREIGTKVPSPMPRISLVPPVPSSLAPMSMETARLI